VLQGAAWLGFMLKSRFGISKQEVGIIQFAEIGKYSNAAIPQL